MRNGGDVSLICHLSGPCSDSPAPGVHRAGRTLLVRVAAFLLTRRPCHSDTNPCRTQGSPTRRRNERPDGRDQTNVVIMQMGVGDRHAGNERRPESKLNSRAQAHPFAAFKLRQTCSPPSPSPSSSPVRCPFLYLQRLRTGTARCVRSSARRLLLHLPSPIPNGLVSG